MNSLIVILGPTAAGKSALALKLAKKFKGYIISADSRQVYRGLDIGTAKPSKAELHSLPHELINVVAPKKRFTVAEYQSKVFSILKTRPDLPFLVGGTGLYIDSVLQNWQIPSGKPNDKLRRQLEKLSLANLVKRLRKIDPSSAWVIDLKNKRRVVRALVVALQSGQSFIHLKKQRPLPYRVLKIGLAPPRPELIERINKRVDIMMKRGLLNETRRLVKRYGFNAPAQDGLGYRQLIRHLKGELTLPEAVERIKIETRQYAKRQMTWFKRDESIHWVRTASAAEQLIRRFLHV